MAKENENAQEGKFGTFKGVFVPSILTIFGVIMYLRTGWVLGNVGLFQTILIVVMSSTITLLTGLSIAASATNMKVKAGGTYYMLSRSFGLETGAAIGVPLYFAQALGVSFYLAGFAESVRFYFPEIPMQVIGVVTLLFLAFIAFKSADLALRAQIFIFITIIGSLISFFLGGEPNEDWVMGETAISKVPFWAVFAVFFPAVTGIEAGVALSGNLRNPGRSLALGTIAAVLVGTIVYIAIPVFLDAYVPADILIKEPLIMTNIAAVGFLIPLGLWMASLSSGLGALLGGPRTLQALARDGVVPSFIGKGEGAADEPRRATIVTFAIALVGILLGDLDEIAKILSMFFLTAYGALNLAAGIEGFIGNPSWRPSIRTPWVLSIAGFGGCIACMFMIAPGATFMAGLLSIFIYSIMRKRNLRGQWSDIRRSLYQTLGTQMIYKLAQGKPDAKSWRPQILLLTGSPKQRWHLVELAHSLVHGEGLISIIVIVVNQDLTEERLGSMEESMRQFATKQGVNCLVEIYSEDDFIQSAKSIVRHYGIGPMSPNTVILGQPTEKPVSDELLSLMLSVYHSKKNLLLVRHSNEGLAAATKTEHKGKRIDVWRSDKDHNSSLMLALAFLLKTSTEWVRTKISIRSIVESKEEEEGVENFLKEFLKKARMKAETVIYHRPDIEGLATGVNAYSQGADLVLVGLKRPDDMSKEAYKTYLQTMIDKTATIPRLLFVLAGEEIDFNEIFEE